MADEYISCDAARRTIIGLEMRDCTGCRRYEDGIGDDYCFNEALLVACGAISAIPAADVAEVRHGRWIGFPDCLKYPNAYSDDHIVCSVCEECFSILDNDTERFDFCPHCGAKMDESEG